MATMGKVKSRDEYIKDSTEGFVNNANTQINTRKAGNEEYITKFNATTDAATQAVTDQYQGRIDKAPDKFQGQYDANAVAQAVQRKQLEESMANMGLTSSGLNASNQTALAVQRMNADASTRAQQASYVSELESAIDEAIAKGEYAKSTNANETRHDTLNWGTDLLTRAYEQGQAYGRADEQTDFGRVWNQYVLDTEKEMQEDSQAHNIELAGINHGYNKELAGINFNNSLALQNDAQDHDLDVLSKSGSSGTGVSGTQVSYDDVFKLMELTGVDYDTAAATLASGVSTGDAEKDTYNANYATGLQSGYSKNEASIYAQAGGGEAGEDAVAAAAMQTAGNFLKGMEFNINTAKTFISGKTGDGEAVADSVGSVLNANSYYKSMSPTQAKVTAAAAVAQVTKNGWPKDNGDGNKKRIKSACSKLGIDFDDTWAIYQSL